jgi:hypothetical protein
MVAFCPASIAEGERPRVGVLSSEPTVTTAADVVDALSAE